MRSALAAGLVLAAVAVSGCFQYGSSSVFGPLAGDSAGAEPTAAWAFSVKAKPAQGPTPLRVTFTLDVRDAPADLPWSADFGDGTPPVIGHGSTATLQHLYLQEGKHQVFITIGGGGLNATRGTLTVAALPPNAPAHPDEEVEAKPLPPQPPATQRAEPPRAAPTSSSSTGSTTSPSSSSSTGPTGSSSSSTSASGSPGNDKGNKTSSSASASASNSSSSPSPSTSSAPPTTGNETSSSSSTESTWPTPSESPTPSQTETSSSSSSAASSTTPPPTPANAPPDASLSADPATASAPATVTFTLAVGDPDGDAVTWTLAVDGATIGSGTGADSPQSFTQTYDAPGNHTAILTASDGVETIQRQATVTITAAQDPPA